MIRETEITLYTEEPHGVMDDHTPTQRTVMAEIRSVRNNEFYMAMSNDIQPTYIFRLTDYAEYGGEKLCKYDGDWYRIIRTYTPVNGQVIDLTVQKLDKFKGGGGT